MKLLMWMKINENNLSEFDIKQILEETGLEPVDYLYEEDKLRHYFGIFLAKEILKKNVTNQKKKIVKTPFGKPYFEDLNNIHFNISHSENLVVCAFSDTEIGVDVEKIRKFPNEIKESIYTLNEKNYIDKSCDADKASFLIWTLKESYLKYKGIGIVHIDKVFDTVKDGKLIRMYNDNIFEHVQLCDEYVVTICTNNNYDDLIVERYYYDKGK